MDVSVDEGLPPVAPGTQVQRVLAQLRVLPGARGPEEVPVIVASVESASITDFAHGLMWL